MRQVDLRKKIKIILIIEKTYHDLHQIFVVKKRKNKWIKSVFEISGSFASGISVDVKAERRKLKVFVHIHGSLL